MIKQIAILLFSQVGLAFYQQTLVNVWLSETHDQCLLMKNIASCLKSTYSEIVQSCLDWILNFEGKFSIGSKANIVASIFFENFKIKCG